MRCRHGGPDRSVNNLHHPEASFIFPSYIAIVVVPSSVNVSAMDRVDANEGRRRQLLGGSAEVIRLRAEGGALFRVISSSSICCIGFVPDCG